MQDGDILWGSPKLQIFFGVGLDIPGIFWGIDSGCWVQAYV